jgi:hypothetical protein
MVGLAKESTLAGDDEVVDCVSLSAGSHMLRFARMVIR